MTSVSKYLAAIGRRGGLKSRRPLDAATARAMVSVREARRAFLRFRASCFWSYRPDLTITRDDVPWVAEQLMKHGNREAWTVGAKLRSYGGADAATPPGRSADRAALRVRVVRRDAEPPSDALAMTPAERIGAMRSLARNAWAFSGESLNAGTRLSRHVVRVQRRAG